MSTLWTPSGEHRVPREQHDPGSQAPSGSPGAPGERAGPGRSAGPGDTRATPDLSDLTPEEQAQLSDELADLQGRLAATPVEDVIANHAYGLFELAALHLSRQPPDLPEARLAIDAFGAVVEGLGERLAAHAATLREGLAQIRLAFVQITAAIEAGDAGDAGERGQGGDPQGS